MITPSKFTSYDESILNKMTLLLDQSRREVRIIDLLKEHEKNFNGIDEFIYSLDVLYVLGCIDVDFVTRMLKYAD